MLNEECNNFEDGADLAACCRTQYEDTEMRYVKYHFFDTLFCLLGFNKLYSLSTADVLKLDKVE